MWVQICSCEVGPLALPSSPRDVIRIRLIAAFRHGTGIDSFRVKLPRRSQHTKIELTIEGILITARSTFVQEFESPQCNAGEMSFTPCPQIV